MFYVALDLPFHVLLVHKQTFKTSAEALDFAKSEYESFPFSIMSSFDVMDWEGSVFWFPARWKEDPRER